MKKIFALFSFIFLLGSGCVPNQNIQSSLSPISSPSVTTTSVQLIDETPVKTFVEVAQPEGIKPIVNTEVRVMAPVPIEKNESDLSNNNYYTNSAGNRVHAPAYEIQEDVVPSGASARCGDGTYSFSQSRRGTCSHHGGVSEWL